MPSNLFGNFEVELINFELDGDRSDVLAQFEVKQPREIFTTTLADFDTEAKGNYDFGRSMEDILEGYDGKNDNVNKMIEIANEYEETLYDDLRKPVDTEEDCCFTDKSSLQGYFHYLCLLNEHFCDNRSILVFLAQCEPNKTGLLPKIPEEFRNEDLPIYRESSHGAILKFFGMKCVGEHTWKVRRKHCNFPCLRNAILLHYQLNPLPTVNTSIHQVGDLVLVIENRWDNFFAKIIKRERLPDGQWKYQIRFKISETKFAKPMWRSTHFIFPYAGLSQPP
eukprot:855118_1